MIAALFLIAALTALIIGLMPAAAVIELTNTRPPAPARRRRRPHRAEPLPIPNRIPRDMPIPGMWAGKVPKRRVAAGHGALAALDALRAGPLGWVWEPRPAYELRPAAGPQATWLAYAEAA